jgi:hypothetical protein
VKEIQGAPKFASAERNRRRDIIAFAESEFAIACFRTRLAECK